MSEVRPHVEGNGNHAKIERRSAPGLVARDRGMALVGDPAGFIVALENELQRMCRYDDSSCLMMVAPDRRITVRSMDLLGARFAANLRSYDALCRYGANHFLVLLPHVGEVHVAGIARRLSIQVAGYPVETVEGPGQFVTAMVGSAMLDLADSLNGNIDRAVQAYKCAGTADGATEKPPHAGMAAGRERPH
jgi:hypothetical protein